MPVNDFNGRTFVAFIDISGFKYLMQQNEAPQALNKLYSAGYHLLYAQNDIEGFFVSDSGILFSRNTNNNICSQLSSLLNIIRGMNLMMLQDGYMLTTSIAYGEFSYHNRIEFPGIEKNPIYGGAYVKAFIDNENGSPKLEPGLCRIVYDDELKSILNKEDIIAIGNQNVLRVSRNHKHIQFFWNIRNNNDIEEFERAYKDSYNAKYAGIFAALQQSVQN